MTAEELRVRPGSDGSVAIDPDPVVVLFRPVAQMRSPIVARRSARPGPADAPKARPDLPSFLLPSARELVRPTIWAIVAAVPILVLFGWLPATVTGLLAAVTRAVHTRVGRATFSFGDGFVAFRGYDRWPQGVQEDDEVRWNWSPGHNAPSGHARG